jgi:hypothetical protein
MTLKSLLKTLYPTAAALLCGAVTMDAGAYENALCGQAGIMKHPATDASKWTNQYCTMENNSGSTLELDFPLPVSVSSGIEDIGASVFVYGSGTSNAPVTVQLISVTSEGQEDGTLTMGATGFAPNAQEIVFPTGLVPSGGYVFIAAFAGSGSAVYGVHWSQ